MNLRSEEFVIAVTEMSNFIRSEDIGDNYLNLLAGKNILNQVNNIRNQIVFGRRGTGKTHLLRAVEELCHKTMREYRRYPVYIDLRNVSTFEPALASNNKLQAIVYFQHILNKIIKSLIDNFEYIVNPLNHLDKFEVNLKKGQIGTELKRLGVLFEGESIDNLGEFSIGIETNSTFMGNFSLKDISLKGNYKKTAKENQNGIRYIKFGDISGIMENIVNILDLHNITLLLDEWSEIDLKTQPFLSHLLKLTFVASPVKLKIGAIKFRTRLLFEEDGTSYGLEDGGDIFGLDLDNKYVYEINKNNTRSYFSELLYNHLSHFNEVLQIYWSPTLKSPSDNFFNDMFTPQALKELLIGSAGVSRDFLNIFINTHAEYLNDTERKITVHHVRRATQTWYRLDKQNRIDSSKAAKILLDRIVDFVIRKKKVTHFLIPQNCFENEHLQRLVDLRVIHIIKRGYSHQDIKGIVYDVYSVDYGCYTNSNFTTTQLDMKTLEELEVIEDLREVRRIALDEDLFLEHKLEVGEGLICSVCKKIVDTSHPAFIKNKLCNKCWEVYDKKLMVIEEN